MKKHVNETQYAKASAYKAMLDETFRAGNLAQFVEWITDGEVLALTNLLANRRVRVFPRTFASKITGLLDGGYQARLMDKERLKMKLLIEPTDTYIYGCDCGELLGGGTMPRPPQEHLNDETKPIPIWFDIHGNFVEPMWRKILSAVLTMISLRSVITTRELKRCFTPSLEGFELRLVVEWLVKAGGY